MNVRKRGQVAALLRLLRDEFAGVTEIVDVGAGHGHLTVRAATLLAVPAVGVERDPQRVAVARALAGDRPVSFVAADVFAAESPLASLPPNPKRLLMALHGCGDLGDAVVTSAVATGARVLLLGCCPQKIRGVERAALVPGGPSFPREVLGLANVLARTAGVEGDLRQALATKESRLALRYMLAARGASIPAGEEMRGVNRRKANAGFAVFAEAVCRVRNFPAPTPGEVANAATQAHAHYLAQRRLSLPRSMLGRVLEIFLAVDRAMFLQSHGYDARVIQVFPTALSPRNLAVLGL
jgi:SAM-dependent methyltransferase